MFSVSLQWHHSGCNGISNHRHINCLLNCLFMCTSKKTSKLASLAFVRGIHRWPLNSPQEGPVTRRMFPFDDVIMFCTIPLLLNNAVTYMAELWKMNIRWRPSLTFSHKFHMNCQCQVLFFFSACISSTSPWHLWWRIGQEWYRMGETYNGEWYWMGKWYRMGGMIYNGMNYIIREVLCKMGGII